MIQQTLLDMGFTIDSKLVRDDFDGRQGSASWAVTISRNGQAMQVEYTAGCAHRHYRNGKPIQLPCRGLTVDQLADNKASKPNEPTLVDVISSVVSDTQCVAFGQTFEDFCDEFGYDEDSRSAERIFNACRDEFFGLNRLGANLDELSELFQDY